MWRRFREQIVKFALAPLMVLLILLAYPIFEGQEERNSPIFVSLLRLLKLSLLMFGFLLIINAVAFPRLTTSVALGGSKVSVPVAWQVSTVITVYDVLIPCLFYAVEVLAMMYARRKACVWRHG